MRRRLTVVLASMIALALAAVAQADGGGPGPGVSVGWDGVLAPNGLVRYVAVPGDSNTVVEAIRTSDGRVTAWGSLGGAFGIPLLASDGSTGGVSRDGQTLVLADFAQGGPTLRNVSHFVVYDPKQLQAPNEIIVPGDFSFDALSPHGKTLYLIQHLSAQDISRYVVRAYDLQAGRLLPGRIADRTQKSWVMQGYALTRTTSDDGRWAYTLYQNPGGTPFIHALDTVRGVAHCIGVPWQGTDQNALWNLRLTLHDGGKRLAVSWKSGRKYLNVDTHTWRVTAASASFPWRLVAGSIAAALAIAAFALLLFRRLAQRVPQEFQEAVAVDR
jgi:hypothetical protein